MALFSTMVNDVDRKPNRSRRGRCERAVGLQQLRSQDSSNNDTLDYWLRHVWKRRRCVPGLAQFNRA
ncbi:hypothetical protein T11_2819 [Trichinella zimbabwensis]|uniref:Uncharacterized protein n=1 Tax=Trichinella zimbabwensis TaxID=268475 RepID=A0A0V1I7S6_9BILA|nr:hypothetical protein T11_2819 [Trichinella zimbabwensis]